MLDFSKVCFYLSMSLFVLLFCFHATSYINRIEDQRREAEVQRIEKKKRLDDQYISDFGSSDDCLHSMPDMASYIFERIEQIEKDAAADGYDRAEIADLRYAGQQKSFLERRELLKE